ncbi:MAG: hypothetical protein L0Z73_19895 [Gammaproteobacteria bacterium]|nr:hypothetical protein [Gammaproteobacteria bacterium]
MTQKEITLVVPGLRRFADKAYGELPGPIERLAALELMIARSRKFKTGDHNLIETLWRLFGMPPVADAGFPMAALAHSLKYETSPGQWYMHCDPVVIQPNRDHLLMLGNSHLDLTEREAAHIIRDINAAYEDQPWRVKLVSPHEWIMEMPDAPAIKTHPMNSVIGKKINDFLPSGRDAKTWRALMNEWQMLLHSHPVNQTRADKGLPVANSVWFWGEGRFPVTVAESKTRQWAQCWSCHTATLALAKLNKIPRVDAPETGSLWLAQAVTPGSHLVVIDYLDAHELVADPAKWRQMLSHLNEQWFAPLLSALQERALYRIILFTADGWSYELTAALAKRWWKRIKALN